MSRGQENAEILGIPSTDPRMLAIPLAASSLWLRLVEAMRRMRATTLRFGDHVPDHGELARVLAVSEAELGLCLDPLVRVGLLLREEDGALTSPTLVEQAERRRMDAERRAAAVEAFEAEVARAQAAGEEPPASRRAMTSRTNGRNGGRPRKDGSPPSQRAMPFYGVVPSAPGNPGNPTGFVAKPEVAKPENPSGFEASRGLTDCLDSDQQSVRQSGTHARETQETHDGETRGAETQAKPEPPAAPETLDRIGRRVLAIAGLSAGSWAANSRPIAAAWLSMGLTEAQIVEEAEAAVKRAAPGSIRKIGFFNPVLREAADRRRPGATAEPEVVLTAEQEESYRRAVAGWEAALRGGDFKPKHPRRAAFSSAAAA